MSGPGTVRTMQRQDLDRVLELEPVLFGRDAWSWATYEGELTWPGRYYVVVELDEQVAGYAGIDLSPEATVLTVGVDPSLQRRGLGRQMMATLLAAATDAGCRQVFLEVRAEDLGAQQLYTGFGFEKMGIRRRYYRHDGADALTMRLRWDRPGPVGREIVAESEEHT